MDQKYLLLIFSNHYVFIIFKHIFFRTVVLDLERFFSFSSFYKTTKTLTIYQQKQSFIQGQRKAEIEQEANPFIHSFLWRFLLSPLSQNNEKRAHEFCDSKI